MRRRSLHILIPAPLSLFCIYLSIQKEKKFCKTNIIYFGGVHCTFTEEKENIKENVVGLYNQNQKKTAKVVIESKFGLPYIIKNRTQKKSLNRALWNNKRLYRLNYYRKNHTSAS